MAKVSLRIYNREIEGFIDQGNLNEAIAHCHHILRTFPKHLATYRLLAKAYLESKSYSEAVDVFGRVLMSVPDDFVSHVGMSIIHDEENKLDDAIWHMQRAFESQPSNPAIQGELQRLYGRRDGMEPPKIRMTRGALAQMYVQGELYPQAIAEIRAVLAQEPDRADMQVLLARAYFRGGQKADATDMCTQLLKRYLYCFDANRIMVDLLPATAGAIESTQVYRMRVGELDPYATFAKGSVFQSDEVADAAINLERLEYKEEEPKMGQRWGESSGVGTGALPASMFASTSSSDQPDWLKSGGFSDSQLGSLASSQAAPTPDSFGASQSSDNIPDFLRDAGWGESNNAEQPASFFDSESAGGDLTPAEIPDWLKGQVPSNMAQPDKLQRAPAQSIETPDWLSGLDDSQTAESEITQSGNGPDSLTSFESSQLSQLEPAQPGNVPDWLSGLDDSKTSKPAQSGNVPDWLSGLDDSKTSEPAQPGNVPDWLSGLGDSKTSEPAQPGNVPDWLSGLDDSKTSEPIQPGNVPDWLSGFEDSKTSEPAQPGNVPDWLSGLDDSKTSEPIQPGNVPDWLSGLEDSKTSEPAQPGNVPDWLSGLDDSKISEPAQPADIPDWIRGSDSQNVSAQSDATIESLGSTAQEQDDAVAWLESLAAKHGAKPEELVTDPSKRSETPPEWVSQAQNIDQQVPTPKAFAPSVESLGSTAQEQDDAVAWLESLAAKHGAKPEELVTDPSKRSETPPEWVSQAQNIDQQVPTPKASAPSVESLGSTAQEQDDAVAWLESLAAKHGAKPEELVTDPSKRSETPPEWVSQAQNIDQQVPAPQAPVPSPSVESLGSTAQEQDDAVAWLESLAAKHGAKPEELVTDPSKRFDKPPEWVSQAQSIGEAQSASALVNAEEEKSSHSSERVENALNIGEQYFAEFESASTAAPASLASDETSMWLRDLEEKEKQDEFSTQPASDNKDIPDWLSDTQQPESAGGQFDFKEQEPAAQKSDLPDWLSDVEDKSAAEETFVSQVVPQDDLADWLSGLDDEPGLPFDQLPTPDSILISSMLTKPTRQEPIAQKSDLPDWLSDVDSQSGESEDEWKKSIAQEEPVIPASMQIEEPIDQTQEEPAPVSLTENLPDWLQGMDEEETAPINDDDLAPWLHREAFEAKEAQLPKPTSPSDWRPVESIQPVSTPAQKKETSPVDVRKTFAPQVVPSPEPFVQGQPPVERPVETGATLKKKSGLPAKQRQPEAQSVTVALNQAKGELDRGDIPAALDHYKKLIKKGKHIEETIRDLTESIYRYPVEVGIWQTLGDAYMRANRLKEALEAYNKAEELIR